MNIDPECKKKTVSHEQSGNKIKQRMNEIIGILEDIPEEELQQDIQLSREEVALKRSEGDYHV